MSTKEQEIKKIADGLGLSYAVRDQLIIINQHPNLFSVFNPYENEADAFKVLTDLIEDENIYISDMYKIYCDNLSNTGPSLLSGSSDLKEAICEAWLAVNKQ